MCFDFLYNFFQHKNSMHYHKCNLVGLCVKYFVHIVAKNEIVQQVLVNSIKFHENPSSECQGAPCTHTVGQAWQC